MSERQSKQVQDRHERMLNEIVKRPGNEICADCNSKNPRWASYSLGIFLCIRCAGIHRKMGTHISKVKSISMDQWNTEQLDMMRNSGGNAAVNKIVNPNPDNHRLPLAADDEHAMERYIRAKWEKRAFMNDNRVTIATTVMAKPTSANPITRVQTLPKRSSSVPAAATNNQALLQNPEQQLLKLGFTDNSQLNAEALRTGGNVDIAAALLNEQKNQRSVGTGGGFAGQNQLNTRSNSVPVLSKDLSLDLNSTPVMATSVSNNTSTNNPFAIHQQQQLQQLQQLQQQQQQQLQQQQMYQQQLLQQQQQQQQQQLQQQHQLPFLQPQSQQLPYQQQQQSLPYQKQTNLFNSNTNGSFGLGYSQPTTPSSNPFSQMASSPLTGNSNSNFYFQPTNQQPQQQQVFNPWSSSLF